ncbi:MAG: hypothetical protein J6S09_00600 [Paludibacteraceae bacterium]|nr:hypothetical protein [Paludibacteraceae bacterium]
MKKLFSLCMICLFAVSAMAQRAAVMEFKAGVGISQADVDGLSGIFTTYFRPSGYTMIERTQIDRIIDEQQFQRSSLTESQMVRIGELLNLSKIVIGDVNIVMGQYNVDVRVINVESGTIAATEGATFAGSSYREGMKNLATKLASQIAIGAGPTVSAQPSANPQPRTTPYVIYGYLKVFPNDLGTFDAEPRQVISRLNESQQFGYGSWRLPTNEELALMRANNLIGSGNYMTRENKKGIVRLVTDKEKGVVVTVPAGYVDLGLSSGTYWKETNESGFYNYDNAVSKFGDKLPTKEQLEELKNECEWTWTGNGYKVIGSNGESIMLPAAGYRDCSGGVGRVGAVGGYWSSTPYDLDLARSLYFDSSGVDMYSDYRCYGLSVRLVQ